MFSRATGHMRHNVVAYLALFIALGGTSAWAAGQITGSQIKDESITGLDVQNNTLKGDDVDEASLTGVDAESLDGKGPGEYGSAADVNRILAVMEPKLQLTGIPESPGRRMQVRGRWLEPDSVVTLEVESPSIPGFVNGGTTSVGLDGTVDHTSAIQSCSLRWRAVGTGVFGDEIISNVVEPQFGGSC